MAAPQLKPNSPQCKLPCFLAELSLRIHSSRQKGARLTSNITAFLVFLAVLAVLRWQPDAGAAKALRVVLWTALSAFAGLLLLFSLFTLWWPPAHVGAVFWSTAALMALVVAARRG